MHKLAITVDDSGKLHVSVDGVIVGLISTLSVYMDVDLQPVPLIHVTMTSIKKLPDMADKTKLRRILQTYKDALREHPLVKVADHDDTLPQGMLAIQEDVDTKPEER